MKIHENLLNSTTGATAIRPYRVSADTCEFRPKINFEFEGLTENEMLKALKILITAFRKVEASNDETGEVIYDHYESSEIFAPTATPTEAIDNCMMAIYDC